MEILEYTPEEPNGKTRVLTPIELAQYADKGNPNAKREIFREEISKASTIQEQIAAIIKRIS